MTAIDVNSDLGEGYGRYRIAPDAELMPLITSANIACGAHAGDPMVMDETVALASAHQVKIGAHVGYPDLPGFGRRAMALSLRELELTTIAQLGTLRALAEHRGQKLSHANFHGALGNLSFADTDVARTLLKAVKAFDPTLKFVGLPETEAVRAADRLGIEVIPSFLADRGYSAPGRLAPRGVPGALITDTEAVRQRVAETLDTGLLTLVDGSKVALRARSVLVHSDTPRALELAHAIRAGIADAGLTIAAYG
ncbi:LamB/YcsF family protein [Pseudooceanicola sp. CBS1P-1]|uniref:5-oxoprolinase subunit PxpA n=1 Tax=Pseudooceanicola albus TaxID=2692189 RepID=A0A6L7G6T7_9RHOB|nr:MULTISPECIES: 5-oxoprolinase subunit PxpA [Pseudooceanicola]MBT9386183.1 LamB/YcsF family protein [Pseudooceanicola endophyticus]MXN19402.1 5-oxoprolinase subunit PxpA [Pseudooceanicola albus]